MYFYYNYIWQKSKWIPRC